MQPLIASSSLASDTQTLLGCLYNTQYARRGKSFGLLVLNSTVFSPGLAEDDIIKDLTLKIEHFERLERGWDGYNSDIVSLTAIQQAKKFLSENSGTILPFYFVAPGVNGEVMIELKDVNKASEIFFNPDGSTELLLYDENNEVVFEGTLKDDLRRLYNYFI